MKLDRNPMQIPRPIDRCLRWLDPEKLIEDLRWARYARLAQQMSSGAYNIGTSTYASGAASTSMFTQPMTTTTNTR
jgi:hypothetical protein